MHVNLSTRIQTSNYVNVNPGGLPILELPADAVPLHLFCYTLSTFIYLISPEAVNLPIFVRRVLHLTLPSVYGENGQAQTVTTDAKSSSESSPGSKAPEICAPQLTDVVTVVLPPWPAATARHSVWPNENDWSRMTVVRLECRRNAAVMVREAVAAAVIEENARIEVYL